MPGPGRLESALWSVAPNTRDLDDRNAFGEIVFADSSGALPKAEVEKNPIQALREELYRTSFARPPAWKDVPDPLPQPLGSWQFRADPLEVGVKEQWFARELEAKGWVRVQVPSFWAENPEVGDYQGDGWYRVTFTVPEAWRGRPVRLLFGAADEQAWVYVNGALVREHTEASEAKSINALWETPFAADVAPENLAYGKENVLAVRVRNSKANGGLWRPVVGHAVPAK